MVKVRLRGRNLGLPKASRMPSSLQSRSSILFRGVAAGAAGGILLGAVIAAEGVRGAAHISPGESAALYAAACVAWGIGYAWLSATQLQIDRRPVISGLSFGAVVYLVTQIVLYGVAAEQTHTAQQVAFGLIATCLLFGLPVAFVSRALGQRA